MNTSPSGISHDDRVRIARKKAQTPSLIEYFAIEGLYGYRNISMDMAHAASVFISQNGAGKTTLLAALNAVLCRQFGKLKSLDFKVIRLKLQSIEEIIIRKEDINHVFESEIPSELLSRTNKIDATPGELYRYLIERFSPEQSVREYLSTSTLLDKVASTFDYSPEKASAFCIAMQRKIYGKSKDLLTAYDEISSIISHYEVVYLPTYRRIELVLDEDKSMPLYSRRKPALEFASESLYSGNMQFGLSDISDQLTRLNNQLTQQSDSGYRKISVNIINDLLDNQLAKTDYRSLRIPSESELKIFFSRIGKPSLFGPNIAIEIPDLDKIYNRPLDDSNESTFLLYFLNKLDSVIEETKAIEAPVGQFADTCNKYLGSDKSLDSGFWSKRYYSTPVDPKEIIVDRSTLSISVRSVNRAAEIPLDALSSGEKQMVSLFAKMYLSPTNKIVLIDEPELSLSIGWQTLILPDIFSAPSCHQLLAITHSPFIFENFLEEHAKSLNFRAVKQVDLFA